MKVEWGNELDLRDVHDKVWMLINPFYIIVTNDDGSRVEIKLPAGMLTDLCSVPRAPFTYLLFGGKGRKAGATHDGLYNPWKEIKVLDMETRQPVEYDRAWADAVLYAALKKCGIGWKAWWMYKGVRVAGWQFYKRGAQSISANSH